MTEELVRFTVSLDATIEVTKLEWEAYQETTEGDDDDAMWELGNAVEGSEFPIPDGRVWITAVDKIAVLP